MEYSDVYGKTTDQEIQGYINLNLAIILKACSDGDREWLLSSQFNRIILCIPDKSIQRALGVGLIDMTPRQIANMLIKKMERGAFKDIKTNYLWGPVEKPRGED
tara:strand:- start:92 stop:403 length:312 start_codon:yes stop_codon:yes gene_type:complete